MFIKLNFDIDFSQARYENEARELLLYCMESFEMFIISYLVKHGTDPQPIINDKFFLSIIVHDFDLEFFKCLVDHGLDVNYVNDNGYSILYNTKFEGRTDLIHYLIEQSVDPNSGNV